MAEEESKKDCDIIAISQSGIPTLGDDKRLTKMIKTPNILSINHRLEVMLA
jgi:hypothetical protein